MSIREFLDLLKMVGGFDTEKIMLFFEQAGSLEDSLFFTSDSRNVKKNAVFIAIKGERVDGHAYVNQSFQNGALLAIIEDPGPYEGLCLKVESVVRLINQLASYIYLKNSGYTIAVTGSNGKTTTKEWIKNLLIFFESSPSVFANSGNMNTEIGLPLCILNDMTEPKKRSVIEMGMSEMGDIDFLVDTYKPDFPVILNIGTAHIGNTGSLENTFKEKIKLLKHHAVGQPFSLNVSDPFLKRFYKQNQLKTPIFFGLSKDKLKGFSGVYLNGFRYRIENKSFLTDIKLLITSHQKESEMAITLKGFFHQGLLLNLCASLAVVQSLAYDIESIHDFTRVFKTVKDRFETEFVDSHLFIKDCYNSSLESLGHALELLKHIKNEQSFSKAYCILGSVAETGDFNSEIHEKIGKRLNDSPIDTVFLYIKDHSIRKIQKTYKGHVVLFDDIHTLAKAINRQRQKDKKAVFLFKASRSIQLEEVFNHVMDAVS